MRRIVAVAASLAVAVAAGVLVLGTLTATAAACAGTVQINSLAFNPPVISAGQSSTATLVAQNCTSQPIQAFVTWAARYTGPGTGIPPGCPVIDPLQLNLALPAGGQGTSSMGYQTFASCTATGFQATATISAGGSTLASQSATLTFAGASGSSSPPPATCAVSYARQSEWAGGFVAQVTIANTGSAPVSGWRLAFTFPGDQVVGNAWNATISQWGAAVTAVSTVDRASTVDAVPSRPGSRRMPRRCSPSRPWSRSASPRSRRCGAP